MDLENIFKSVAEKLKIDFQYMSSEIEHRLSKGRIREVELVEQFLTRYLPSKVGISHGEIVASNGEVSNECDIVIYEAYSCPFLLKKSGFQIFPIECVHGVLEVKSNLNKNEIVDSFEKITKVKKFPKTAYEEQQGAVIRSTNLYGKEWPYFPTMGIVFAYDSIDLLSLKEYLLELQSDIPISECIDSVWILNKGMIVYYDDDAQKIMHSPTPKSRLRAIQSENPLLLMTVFMQMLFQSSWMPKFNIRDYLKHASYGAFMDN